jgi:hypothetical protein
MSDVEFEQLMLKIAGIIIASWFMYCVIAWQIWKHKRIRAFNEYHNNANVNGQKITTKVYELWQRQWDMDHPLLIPDWVHRFFGRNKASK